MMIRMMGVGVRQCGRLETVAAETDSGRDGSGGRDI